MSSDKNDINRIYEMHLNALLEKIIENQDLNPPFNITGDIVSDFKKRCDTYINCINQYMSENKNNTPNFKDLVIKTEKIRNGIEKSLTNFLSGDIKAAYDSFDETFSDRSIIYHLHRITIPLSDICNHKKPLFRVRKSNSHLSNRHEIFHIPFSDRHNVCAQRYSVAGLPCLYLGTSLYVCWQEMNKPDFDKLFISSFITTSNESKILNFASEFLHLPVSTDQNDESVKYNNLKKGSYMIFWPLIIACNYLRSNTSANFIQEYIIPNLLMQWISNKPYSTITGVAYFSTKMPNSRISSKTINIVFPPKVTYEQTVKNNFCPKLTALFEFTPPISWQVLKTLDYSTILKESNEKLTQEMATSSQIRLSGIKNFDDDIIKMYKFTDFHKLEFIIDELFEHKKISVNDNVIYK